MGYKRLAKQLGMNPQTITAHCQMMAHKALLPQRKEVQRCHSGPKTTGNQTIYLNESDCDIK
jgi:DNA-binding IclR family transcriptional regulator